MRLIDADELKNKAYYAYPSIDHYCLSKSVINLSDIQKAHTIEAEPIRHGRWIKNDSRSGWHCSECKQDDIYAFTIDWDGSADAMQDYFCPNCGAKMDLTE